MPFLKILYIDFFSFYIHWSKSYAQLFSLGSEEREKSDEEREKSETENEAEHNSEK